MSEADLRFPGLRGLPFDTSDRGMLDSRPRRYETIAETAERLEMDPEALLELAAELDAPSLPHRPDTLAWPCAACGGAHPEPACPTPGGLVDDDDPFDEPGIDPAGTFRYVPMPPAR